MERLGRRADTKIILLFMQMEMEMQMQIGSGKPGREDGCICDSGAMLDKLGQERNITYCVFFSRS